MDINSAFQQIRPITQLAGTVILIAGLCKFFGVNIPISRSGLELAVAGWLTKSI